MFRLILESEWVKMSISQQHQMKSWPTNHFKNFVNSVKTNEFQNTLVETVIDEMFWRLAAPISKVGNGDYGSIQ